MTRSLRATHWPPGRAVLVAAVVLAATLCCQAFAFDINTLYKYRLHGTISSKIANDDRSQSSGVVIESAMHLMRTGSSELTMLLDKPQAATFSALFGDNIDSSSRDFLDMEPMLGFERSFKVKLDKASGAIESFDSYKDEQKWATNFKRGLLSFFQLKLRQTSEQEQTAPSGKLHQFYSTQEGSVFGECETDYLVLVAPLSGNSEPGGAEPRKLAMNVTKTRDMARCKGRYLHSFVPIDSSECYENDKELRQFKHSSAVFQYDLIGTRDNYVIEQASLEELSTFSPFGQKAHGHLISGKFQLKLIEEVKGGSLMLPDYSDALVRIDTLAYDSPEKQNFYADINMDQEHHLASIYENSASVEQVMQAFEALLQEHRSYTDASELPDIGRAQIQENSRLAELFVRLSKLVGTLNGQKIEQLYTQVDESGDAHKKIFWDLMSVVGTNPSFVLMKRLITEGDTVPSINIREYLTRLSYHIKLPSKNLFDEYANLCKSEKIQTNQQYKRLCLLPLASLIHQHCVKPHTKGLRGLQQNGAPFNTTTVGSGNNGLQQSSCQIASAEEYFARLVAPISSASSGSGADAEQQSSMGEKMLNIKLAGELGVRQSIDYLIDVVARQSEHPSLRSAAMWQLNKAARSYPNQLKRLIVPYYHDRSELLEVRIAAFHNWLKAGMPLHEMQAMSKMLLSEPSRQMVTYVHSLMSSIAKLDDGQPCACSNVRNARLVLGTVESALARHSAPGLTDSRAILSSTWLPEFGYGTSSLLSVIFANDSMMPSNLFYSSSKIMSGVKLSPMSISVQAHGLDKLFKRVLGINGLLADKESFMDVFSLRRPRTRRQAIVEPRIKQELQNIDKELKLASRDFDDIYLSVTISYYGRPVGFFERDSRELKKLLSDDGTIKIPAIKRLIHSFNSHTTQQMLINFEKFEVTNNELGLPLFRSINDFDYKTFKLNNINLDVEPGFFRDERQGKPPSRIFVALDASTHRHTEMFVSSGAFVPSRKQQVGVGFYKKKLVNLPIGMAIEANLTQNTISIKRNPIHESLLYIKQMPVTFTMSYDPARPVRNVSGDKENQWRALYALNNSAQMKPFKLEYMTPLAIGVRLEGKHRADQDWSEADLRRYLNSVCLATAKFMLFYSPHGQPLEMRLSTITSAENPTHELVELFSWRHHHQQQQQQQQRDTADAPDRLNELEQELVESISRMAGQTPPQGLPEQGPPTTVSYKLALLGGSAKERRMAIELAYSRSFDKLLHAWRASYSRTPFDQASAQFETSNLCWLGQMRFPKQQVDKLLNLELVQLDHSVNSSSKLMFGDECQEGKATSQSSDATMVSAHVTFDWTHEQRQTIGAALGFASKSNELALDAAGDQKQNVYSRLYKKCLAKREEHGAKIDPACLQLLHKTGELSHMSAQFDYKDVPEHWTKLARYLGFRYANARADYIEEIGNKPTGSADYYKATDGVRQRAHLEANISALEMGRNERKLSYKYDTPSYYVMYKNVPISIPPLSTFSLFGASFYQQLQRRTSSQSCLVSAQSVTTFDNYTYKMPPVDDGCFKLIAKDCSPEANYLVLGAKTSKYGKTVKVYLGQKFKIEFEADQKEANKVSEIKVNNETVRIEQDKPALRRETKLGQKIVEAFSIDYNGAYYTLNSKLYKVSVSTDGSWIYIQQSKYYSGKSCGLCSDSNGDQLLELRSPQQNLCKNSDDFVWSYVLPSSCSNRQAGTECA